MRKSSLSLNLTIWVRFGEQEILWASIGAWESSTTVPLAKLGESTDESNLVKESVSLLSTVSRSKNLRKKGKGPEQQKGKRSKPVEDQDDKTDEELKKSESLFFKKKGRGQSNSKNQSKSKQSQKCNKTVKLGKEQEDDDVYAGLIKAQTETLKKKEEEKNSYLITWGSQMTAPKS